MPERTRTRLLRLAFGALLLLTVAAASHTAIFSKTPAAIEPELSPLTVPGFTLAPQDRSAPVRARHHALSTHYRWDARPTVSERPGFKLEAVVVHSRTSSGMDIDSLVNTAGMLAAEHEEPQPDAETNTSGEVVLGTTGGARVLRTCISPKGRMLTSSLKTALAKERETGAKARVLQALGMRDNIRWECLLVSISMPKDQASDEALLDAWNSVYPALSTSLQESRR